jgi:hypothetical protein
MLLKPLCSAVALFAMALQSSSASASPISAGTRAAVLPGASLLQEVRCQRPCRPQGRQSGCRTICSPTSVQHDSWYSRGPLGPMALPPVVTQGTPFFLPQVELGPVGAPFR